MYLWKRILGEAQQKARKIKARSEYQGIDMAIPSLKHSLDRSTRWSIHLSSPLTSFHTLNIASDIMVQMHYMNSLTKHKQLTWREELESSKQAISLSISHMIRTQDFIYAIELDNSLLSTLAPSERRLRRLSLAEWAAHPAEEEGKMKRE